jgi:hypothetical protein
MRLLNQVLAEGISTISNTELTAHGFPTALLENEREFQYNTAAFCEVANCDAIGWKVVQPEDGLIYAACLPDCRAENLVRQITRTGRGWRNYAVACFRDRIVGGYSWVPPITSLTMPREHILGLLDRRFYFFVFIDVDHVKRRLAELLPSLSVSDEGGHLSFKTRKEDWDVLRGPRPIENVEYGLASLESALQMLATTPQI